MSIRPISVDGAAGEPRRAMRDVVPLAGVRLSMMRRLEAAALDIIAEHEACGDILRAQIAVAEVVERDFSGAGFFSTFAVPDAVPRLPDRRTLAAQANATFAGVEHGMGIILFVAPDGKIDFLEGFTYGESWDPSRLPALTVAHERVTCRPTS